MKYRVQHRTTYDYSDWVGLSHHVLRLRPRDLPRQKILHWELRFEPSPSARHDALDYFGNLRTSTTMEGPHRRLVIDSLAHVETLTTLPDPPDKPGTPSATPLTGPLESPPRAEENPDEFLHDSPLVARGRALEAFARPSFPSERSVFNGVLDLTARIHREFQFDPQATTVATPLDQILRLRRGVCQDFAHVQIGCLRSLGVPARYVSGYLETLPPPGMPKLVGADASHAWVSFWTPEHGWTDVDPTNNLVPSDRHIIVAYGRDYNEVSPVRGVVVGGGSHTLAVSVDVATLDG